MFEFSEEKRIFFSATKSSRLVSLSPTLQTSAVALLECFLHCAGASQHRAACCWCTAQPHGSQRPRWEAFIAAALQLPHSPAPSWFLLSAPALPACCSSCCGRRLPARPGSLREDCYINKKWITVMSKINKAAWELCSVLYGVVSFFFFLIYSTAGIPRSSFIHF